MPIKKIPVRMCTGCSQHLPKRELVRVVHARDGEISVDLTGKKAGRGAYVCKNVDCLKKARKSKRFERAFHCQIPDTVYDRLEEEIRQSDQ